jgi:hypothetical protein
MNPSKTKIVFALRHAERDRQLGGLTTTGKDQALKLGQKIFQEISDRCSSCVIIVSGQDHGNQTGRFILEAFRGVPRRLAKTRVEPRFSFDSSDDGEILVHSIVAIGYEYEVCIVVGHGSAPVGIARKYAQDMGLPLVTAKEPLFGSGYKIDIEKQTVERFHLGDDLAGVP